MNFWEILFLFIAFQAVLFACYFFVRRSGNKTSNIFLGLFLVLFSLNLGYNVLYWSQLLFTEAYVSIFAYLAVIWTFYPILFYLYVKSIISSNGLQWKDTIHALPIAFVFFCHYNFYVLSSKEKLMALYYKTTNDFILLNKYLVWIIVILMILYAVGTYFSFRNKLASLNRKRWFYWILGSFSMYIVAMLSYFILSRLGYITIGKDYFIMYVIIFFIGVLAYFAKMQPAVFDGLLVQEIIPFSKYRKTGLTTTYSLELKSNLLKLMSEEKPYLQGTIRLDDLAEKLGASRHHTSQIINEHFDTNFFDFINSYRIEESKVLLEDKSLNISDVIYSSGFNNRVSFYKAFKKYTGSTPSDYRASS